MSLHRDFKGVWIPKEIYLDKNLTMMEKLLLTEIDSLSKNDIGCIASNSHLGEFLGVHRSRASHWVKSLSEKGYISVELMYEGNEVIERRLRVLGGWCKNATGGVIPQQGGAKTQQGGCCENEIGTNTVLVNNNLSIISSNIEKPIQEKRKNTKKEKPEQDLESLMEYGKAELKKLDLPVTYEYHLRSKIESWIEAGGKDGHGKPIRNWKSKIKNVIPFLKPTPIPQKTEKKQFVNFVPKEDW